MYNAAGHPCTTRRSTRISTHNSSGSSSTGMAAATLFHNGRTSTLAQPCNNINNNNHNTILLLHHPGETVHAVGVGALAGLVTSLAGLGGGLVMISMLTAAPLALAQHAAHGTALAVVAVTCVTGAVTYRDHFEAATCAVPAVAVAVSGMVTAPWGVRAATRLSPHALQRALACLMLTLAAAIPCQDQLVALGRSPNHQTGPDGGGGGGGGPAVDTNNNNKTTTTNSVAEEMTRQFWHRILPYTAVGGASGFLAGLFGIGGGTLVVPVLTILCSGSSSHNAQDAETAWSHYQVLATSLAATALPAVVGTISHARAGNVVWRVAPGLAAGATLGAVVGGRLGQETDQGTLRTGLTALLAILGTRTLVRVYY